MIPHCIPGIKFHIRKRMKVHYCIGSSSFFDKMAPHELLLDSKIRDWVLLPIFFSSLLVGLGRHYATQLLSKGSSSKPTGPAKPADLDVHRAKAILARARRFRQNAGVLTAEQFQFRKALFNSKKTGLLRPKADAAPPVNPLQDPNMMSNMTKQQMTMMVPQMAMMGFVSYFFTGFVLCKVPFPLTNGFREMLQKGVVLQSLDVSYVSSLSVYFLFAFGLSGLFQIILSGQVEDMMAAQMGMMDPTGAMQQQQNQPFDIAKMFQQERESLDLVHHSSFVGANKAEKRLLGIN